MLSSLVEHYLDSSSSQVLLLLSSIREPHHKVSGVSSPSVALFSRLTGRLRPPQVLLEKLNEALTRPGNRAAAIALLGHLIRKQPPWIHHISQAPVLPTLLRCLKVPTQNRSRTNQSRARTSRFGPVLLRSCVCVTDGRRRGGSGQRGSGPGRAVTHDPSGREAAHLRLLRRLRSPGVPELQEPR